VCKEGKDGAAAISSFLPSNSCIYSVISKARHGMAFEIGCGGSVFQALKTMNYSCACLALRSSTGKGMAWTTFTILEGNVGFEE